MTTRRNLVTGMLAAATLPDAALAAPATVDPISALIETSNAAHLQFTKAEKALNDLVATLPDEVTRCQRVIVGRISDEPIYAQTHQQVSNFFKDYSGNTLPGIRLFSLRPNGREQMEAAEKQFQAELCPAEADAHAELNRDIERMQAAQELSGLTALEDETERLLEIRCDADFDVMQCHPPTVAGVMVKIEYMAWKVREGVSGDEDYMAESLEHIRDSLARMAA